MSLFKLLLSNSFLWLKAIPILVLISVSHLPSLVMKAPWYLNRSTCSSLSPSIVMFISPSPFLDTFMTFIFFMFTFMSYSVAVLLSPSISFYYPRSLTTLMKDHIQLQELQDQSLVLLHNRSLNTFNFFKFAERSFSLFSSHRNCTENTYVNHNNYLEKKIKLQ